MTEFLGMLRQEVVAANTMSVRHTRRPAVLVLLAEPSDIPQSQRTAFQALTEHPDAGVHVVALCEDGVETLHLDPRRTTTIAVSVSGTATSEESGDRNIVLDEKPPDAVARHVANQLSASIRAEKTAPRSLRDLLAAATRFSSADQALTTPIGWEEGDPRYLTLGDDVVHTLVGGQSGAGKSNVLLTLIYGLLARYGPDDCELYLLDMKEGIEFARFSPASDGAAHRQLRVVGLSADREFALSVLTHLELESKRRATAMRAAGARSLGELRAATRGGQEVWPRLVVVIDEFQVLLEPSDQTARLAVTSLERFAREARAVGIHFVLATQTTSGISELYGRSSLLNQYRGRIALRVASPEESQRLLGQGNFAAWGLHKVGEAVLNLTSGSLSGNQIVQVPKVHDEDMRALEGTLRDKGGPRCRVFSGTERPRLGRNAAFHSSVRHPQPDDVPQALLGEPLGLADVLALPFPHGSGSSLAVLAPDDSMAIELLQSAVLTLAARYPPSGMTIDFMLDPDGIAPDSVFLAGLAALGHTPVTGALPTGDLEPGTGSARTRLTLALVPDLLRAGARTTSVSDDLRVRVREARRRRGNVLAWWRSPRDLATWLGPAGRDDIETLLIRGVAGSDLHPVTSQLVAWDGRADRALLLRQGAPRQAFIPFEALSEDDLQSILAWRSGV